MQVDRGAVDVARLLRQLDRLLVVVDGGRERLSHVGDRAEVAEPGRHAARVALHPEERNGLSVERGSAIEVALGDRDSTELGG